MKRCSRCGEDKPTQSFHRDSTRKDGLHHRCKTCKNKYGKEWRGDNPAYYKGWTADRPFYQRLYQGHLRATRFGCRVDELTAELVLAYWEANGISSTLCFYTGEPLLESWHMDHKVPLSRGGSHSLDNVVPCNPDVNLRKGDRTAEEFLGEVSGAA